MGTDGAEVHRALILLRPGLDNGKSVTEDPRQHAVCASFEACFSLDGSGWRWGCPNIRDKHHTGDGQFNRAASSVLD